jgi:hypothetical protein
MKDKITIGGILREVNESELRSREGVRERIYGTGRSRVSVLKRAACAGLAARPRQALRL